MQIFTPDDSSIVAPDANSPGAKFMSEIEVRAKAIYPDHGESRTLYIQEMAAKEINRLTELTTKRNAGSMREST